LSIKRQKKELTSNNDISYIENIINKYDLGGDGKINQEDIDTIERIIQIESVKSKERDRADREAAMRRMTWFALFGMLFYPILIMTTTFFELNSAAVIIGDIAPTYFVSISALVAAFFGVQAYNNK
jgi:hypothetical protein